MLVRTPHPRQYHDHGKLHWRPKCDDRLYFRFEGMAGEHGFELAFSCDLPLGHEDDHQMKSTIRQIDGGKMVYDIKWHSAPVKEKERTGPLYRMIENGALKQIA